MWNNHLFWVIFQLNLLTISPFWTTKIQLKVWLNGKRSIWKNLAKLRPPFGYFENFDPGNTVTPLMYWSNWVPWHEQVWPHHRPPVPGNCYSSRRRPWSFPTNLSPSLSGSEIEMSPDYGRKDARADRMQRVDWILTKCERNCISQTGRFAPFRSLLCGCFVAKYQKSWEANIFPEPN